MTFGECMDDLGKKALRVVPDKEFKSVALTYIMSRKKYSVMFDLLNEELRRNIGTDKESVCLEDYNKTLSSMIDDHRMELDISALKHLLK